MAVGVIPQAAKLSLVHMTQQQVEAQAINMQLLCLVVLTNNIRIDSKATITQLQEGYAYLPPACCHACNHAAGLQWFAEYVIVHQESASLPCFH